MRISHIIGITGAKLLNTPSISGVDKICFDSTQSCERGLFVAKAHGEIKEAIQKGALAILFEGAVEMSDTEIAWLQTCSLVSSCGALLRYFFVDYDLRGVVLDRVQIEIAQSLFLNHEAVFITEAVAGLESFSALFGFERMRHAKSLFHTSEDLPYIFAPREFFCEIDIEPFCFLKKQDQPLRLFSFSLMQSKVQYRQRFYTLPLPFCLLESLQEVLDIAHSLSIPLNLSRMLPLRNLACFYVDDSLSLTQDKNNTRILVNVWHNLELYEKIAHYLEEHVRWAEKLYIIPENIDLEFEPKSVVKTSQSLPLMLKEHFCHIALVYSLEPLPIGLESKATPSLF